MVDMKIKCEECGKVINLLFNVNRQEVIVKKDGKETSNVKINEFYFDDAIEVVCPHCEETIFVNKNKFKWNSFEKRNQWLNS